MPEKTASEIKVSDEVKEEKPEDVKEENIKTEEK